MRRFSFLALMLASLALLPLGGCDETGEEQQQAGQAQSGEEEAAAPPIQLGEATAFATAEGQSAGAVFLRITNKSDERDALIAVRADIGTAAELHSMSTDRKGVMKMRKEERFALEPGKHLVLNPTGPHIMILGLDKPLKEGDAFDITLDFEKAEDMSAEVKVVAPTQAGKPRHEHRHTPSLKEVKDAAAGKAANEDPSITITPPTTAPVIHEHGGHDHAE